MTEFNPAVFNSLCASRKHDRTLIADALTEIATKHGATVERQHREANPGYCGQGIGLRIACKGVGAMIDIDDLHGGKWVLISWYGTEHRGRDFAPAFRIAVKESDVRPHHKATSHPRDWSSLANTLNGGLRIASRGEAFSEPSAT
jgi:hypothetical protein